MKMNEYRSELYFIILFHLIIIFIFYSRKIHYDVFDSNTVYSVHETDNIATK